LPILTPTRLNRAPATLHHRVGRGIRVWELRQTVREHLRGAVSERSPYALPMVNNRRSVFVVQNGIQDGARILPRDFILRVRGRGIGRGRGRGRAREARVIHAFATREARVVFLNQNNIL